MIVSFQYFNLTCIDEGDNFHTMLLTICEYINIMLNRCVAGVALHWHSIGYMGNF